MTPLLLASLGSCAGTRVRIIAEKVKHRAVRIDNFQIEIEAPVELSQPHRVGVESAVHHCLIHNALLHPPRTAIEVKEAVRVE
jgi:hypothetical protein